MTNGASAFDGSITMRGILKSWTITQGLGQQKEIVMARLRNPHPGEILKEEFLNAIGMSQNQLAHTIGVPGNRIHAIVNGTRAITGDTDLRLCKFFGLCRSLGGKCHRAIGQRDRRGLGDIVDRSFHRAGLPAVRHYG